MRILYMVGTVGAVGDPSNPIEFTVRYRISDGSDRMEVFDSYGKAVDRYNKLVVALNAGRVVHC